MQVVALLVEILLGAGLLCVLAVALRSAARTRLGRADWENERGDQFGLGGHRLEGTNRGRESRWQRWRLANQSTHRDSRTGPAQPEPDRDFGLLATVAVVSSAAAADRLRRQLAEAGIRSTTAIDRDGRHRVLVFASELYRARRVGGASS